MAIPNVVLGTVLLIFGRKLFWLFVGIAGFLAGMQLSAHFLSDQPDWVQWVVSIGAGLLGALLAVVAQRVAFAIGGFFAGAYIALAAVDHFGIAEHANVLVVAGGLVGAVIAAIMMDTAIIVLSSLVGAGAIVQALNMDQTTRSLLFVGLVAVGIVVQFKLMGPSKHQRLERQDG